MRLSQVLVIVAILASQGVLARGQDQRVDAGMIRNAAMNRAPRGPAAGIHQPFAGPITAAKIRTAIDDAVMYLRACEGPDGSFRSDDGQTVLAALAILAAGAHPDSDSQLAKALEWLAARPSDNCADSSARRPAPATSRSSG